MNNGVCKVEIYHTSENISCGLWSICRLVEWILYLQLFQLNVTFSQSTLKDKILFHNRHNIIAFIYNIDRNNISTA